MALASDGLPAVQLETSVRYATDLGLYYYAVLIDVLLLHEAAGPIIQAGEGLTTDFGVNLAGGVGSPGLPLHPRMGWSFSATELIGLGFLQTADDFDLTQGAGLQLAWTLAGGRQWMRTSPLRFFYVAESRLPPDQAIGLGLYGVSDGKGGAYRLPGLAVAVPEPSMLTLLAGAVAAVAARRRSVRQRRSVRAPGVEDPP